MDTSNTYNIVLPKGEAERPFFELNEAERLEVGRVVFQEVTRLAAKFGALPVTGSSIKEESSKETD
jgi:hypothetical protein